MSRREPETRSHEIHTIGLLRLDRNGRMLEVNEKAASLMGFPSTWLRGRPLLVFVAKEHVTAVLDLLMLGARSPGSQTLDIEFAGYRRVPVRIMLSTTEGDEFDLEILDLTETRAYQSDLGTAQAQWHSLLTNAPDVILTLDQAGKIVFLNGRLWGYSIPAVVGTSLYNYVSRTAAAKIRRCIALAFSGKRSNCDIVVQQGENEHWYNLSFGIGNRNLEINSTVLFREITEQKRLEDLLRTTSEKYADLAARMETVREDERTRLAREIHDDLGQAMTILKIDLSLLKRSLVQSKTLRRKVQDIALQVDNLVERTHSISSNLRPPILDDIGLVAAIDWLVRQIRKHTRLVIEVKTQSRKIELPTEAATAAFRVVQESLTNVIRHSRAKRVVIQIAQENRRLRISVTDNGCGIPPRRLHDAKSLGLLGMQERIARVGGQFQISSLKGKGTRIAFEIPLGRNKSV